MQLTIEELNEVQELCFDQIDRDGGIEYVDEALLSAMRKITGELKTRV